MVQIGDRFGRLVIKDIHSRRPGGKNFLCLCDCGNEKVVFSGNLTSNKIKSCGCIRSESSRRRLTTHGDFGSVEYVAWYSMKGRCNNPNDDRYSDYGGRGISVCERWNDYANFLADMGRKPSKEHSIDRIDNNGNYEPSNCRWASRSEQALNRRVARLIEIDGVVKNLAEWARAAGVSHVLIWQRLNNGWDAKDAVFKPTQKRAHKSHQNSPESNTSRE